MRPANDAPEALSPFDRYTFFMLRGFRHTLFMLLQVGVIASGVVALALFPASWMSVLICVIGATASAYICDRIASRYLARSLGRLRRLAADIGQGRPVAPAAVHPGEDFYKLASAINLVATRLAEAKSNEEQLADQLRRSEALAMLGELAANVAHEVNNPLDGVQNCARILRRSLDDPGRARQMLDLIDGGLSRIETIVRRLLTLARHHVIRAKPADVRQIIESALRAVANKLENLGVRVDCSFPSSAPSAVVDAPLLEQVFVNLLLNAADSMPDGGTIEIILARDDAPFSQPPRLDPGLNKPPDLDPARSNSMWYRLPTGNLDLNLSAPPPALLRIDIADRGAGIPPDALPHIFEPFFTTKSAGKGTGLGLPIAARIIDAHHGSISVAPRDGGGTTFSVRIPLSSPNAPAALQTHDISAAGSCT